MEYRVILVTNILSLNRAIDRLTEQVKEAIALGWEPVGGIAITDDSVAQAMTKRR